MYGKINGKGKEYNYKVRLIFEGEYVDDIRNGKGKEYNKDKILFIGEYFNGHRNKAKEYINNKLIYEIYEGEYSFDNKWNGKGYGENENRIYELINGNGKVKEYKDNN